jgi:hypothetical protein
VLPGWRVQGVDAGSTLRLPEAKAAWHLAENHVEIAAEPTPESEPDRSDWIDVEVLTGEIHEDDGASYGVGAVAHVPPDRAEYLAGLGLVRVVEP